MEQPSSPAVEKNSHRERKGLAHLIKSTAKAKAKVETKQMVSAQIQTSPLPAPAKETQTPRRERNESVTQTSPVKNPVTKTPATLKEGVCSLSGHQLVVMMQTFATALAAQLNIPGNAANRTGQECNESHSQCLEIPVQDQRIQDEETEQNVNQSGRGHEHIDGDNRPLKILQWNLNSFNSKRSSFMATAYSEQVDIILLQETRVELSQTPKVWGYHVFSEPEIPQQSRGCMILIKNDIPCTKIEEPILCGEGVEIQAVKLYLADTTLVCYNVYRRYAGVLDISELISEAANRKVFIGGDFNAHHHQLESPGPCNRAGIHIIQALDEMPGVRLLNNGEPTHRDGGRLDLSFITEELCGGST